MSTYILKTCKNQIRINLFIHSCAHFTLWWDNSDANNDNAGCIVDKPALQFDLNFLT